MTNDVFRVTIPAKRLPYVIRRPTLQHLTHRNTATTEAKPIFIVTKGVHITMATGNHRNRDETSHTNQAPKEPWKPLKCNWGVTHSHNNIMCYSLARDMTGCYNIHALLHGFFFRGSFLCSENKPSVNFM
jgi:hypothetical protein